MTDRFELSIRSKILDTPIHPPLGIIRSFDFSIDGTFLIGKYQDTLLIAISYYTNNKLVPLAFALVEKENNDSWGWFFRLVRIHMVAPGREVGIIFDRHQGILNAVQEQIEGYAPLHHRWCTRHLAENLLQKDGVKDNFDLF